MNSEYNSLYCFIPPYILDHMTNSKITKVREAAIKTIASSSQTRERRRTLSTMALMAAIPSPERKKHRLVYDMQEEEYSLPGKLVRSEGQKKVKDKAVNEAYDYSGLTYDFYSQLFGRNSLDNGGMSLISSVHYGARINNAFWDGEQMLYGDGDTDTFIRFTKSLDVVGHELTHGVISFESNLEYRDEPGALNESFADVMGALVQHWSKKQPVHRADWRIGEAIMGNKTTSKCLRTFTPEKAFEDDELLGTDPQPKHMSDQYTGSADRGGVHINSGIPNCAFYHVAMELGGNAWEKAGAIWYQTLRNLNRYSSFQDAANETYKVAGTLFSSGEQKAVEQGWRAVGISITVM